MMRIGLVQENFFKELATSGIDRFDLGVMRSGGLFRQRGIQGLDLGGVLRRLVWLRSENRQGADIYFRPAKDQAWPMVFLDDLTSSQAETLSKKYRCWIVQTSLDRHHAWILTDERTPLTCSQRYGVQKMIISKGWGDPGSVSGDHYGRIPGFKNWKRGGTWVNLKYEPNPILASVPLGGSVLNTESVPMESKLIEENRGNGTGVDQSESGREFGWVCGWLRQGQDPEEAIRRLIVRAKDRGKKAPEIYARRTVEAAKRVVKL